MKTRGSEWRKWNFHVHTKGTNKNDQFKSSSMDDFFYTFFKKAYDNQISAIGITDYFSIDRYNEAIKYRDNLFKDENILFSKEELKFIKDIFIFPNVELRISPATKKGKFINLHFIFNPDYVSNLPNNFFNKVKNMEDYLMNEQGLKDYALFLDPKLSSDKQYKFGLENYNIEIGQIKNLLDSNKSLKENSLIAVSSKSNDGVSGLKDYYQEFENEGGSLLGTIKSIYKLSHIIFSNAPSDKDYFLGRKTNVEEVVTNVGSLKPCIIGCDAHTEEDLFSKFTWVKANLDFEGLRQIYYEPEQRVKIQNEKPDIKEDKLLIDSVRYISKNNIFSKSPIYLNPNLNVIIGGKSSGKSILLYAIAKTLSADLDILKNDDESYKYDLNKIEPNFDFEITTKGGFTQNLVRNNDQNSILPEIKYIPQNYLVKLAEPDLNKKGKSLNKLVRDLIIEDITSKNVYQDFLNKVRQNDKARNSQIDLYFSLSSDIKALETELKTKSVKEVLLKNIETNLKRVEELNKSTGLTKEQLEEFKEIQNKIEANKSKRQSFKDDYSVIQMFSNELLQILNNLKQKKDDVINSLQLDQIKNNYITTYSKIDELYNEAILINNDIELELRNDGKKYLKDKSIFSIVFNDISAEQKKFNEAIQPYLKDEQIKKSIDDINLSISNDKKALLDIEILSKKISDKQKLLSDCKTELFVNYENNYNEYLNVLELLKDRTIELEKDGLGILGKVLFNFAKLRNELFAISDGRSASYTQYSILDEKKKAIDGDDFSVIINEIKKLFDEIINSKYVLLNKVTQQNAIKLLLEDYFFDFWEITYKNDKLGEMSTGKASFVILMLIIGLSKSKAPILIDQPEDNLDNRSITNDLVNYLKNKKLERQIIIVTHNANIVVNADAENVIIANQKGQSNEETTSKFKFDYINGAIEDSFDKLPEETDILKSMGIRQHIADIVEGGKEAFIMREKKYRFK